MAGKNEISSRSRGEDSGGIQRGGGLWRSIASSLPLASSTSLNLPQSRAGQMYPVGSAVLVDRLVLYLRGANIFATAVADMSLPIARVHPSRLVERQPPSVKVGEDPLSRFCCERHKP